jgi:hypothetical protein
LRSRILFEVVSSQPPFTPGLTGAAVRIHGLANEPELNGTIEYAAEFIEETGRYKVRSNAGVRTDRPLPQTRSLQVC